MRRIILLLLVMVLAGVLVGGYATFAFFTDTAASENNQFTAGTLDLDSKRAGGDTVSGPMFYVTPAQGLKSTGSWAPGDTHGRALLIENTGSLDGLLKNVRASLESGSRHLADKLQVKVTTDASGNNIVVSGTLGQLIDAEQPLIPVLTISKATERIVFNKLVKTPGRTNLYFWVTFPADADNSYQNETVRAAFTVYAEQKKNNP